MAFVPEWESSPYLCIIHELGADPVTTRYYPLEYQHHHPTPSGEYVIETEDVDRTSSRLVLRMLPKADLFEEDSNVTSQNQDEERVFLDNLICYPSRLADGYHFLLLGKNDDEKMRLLIAPREGQALEVHPLSLSFNEAKGRLEAEWEKRRALRDNETSGTGEQSVVMEENGSEEHRSEENREQRQTSNSNIASMTRSPLLR